MGSDGGLAEGGFAEEEEEGWATGALGGGTAGGGGAVLFVTAAIGVAGMGDCGLPAMFWKLVEGDMGGERDGAGEGELKGDTELTDSEEGLLRGVES